MFSRIYRITLLLLVLNQHTSHGLYSILGLNERLEEFGTCNIGITTSYREIGVPAISVPIALIDTKMRNRLGSSFQFWPPLLSFYRSARLLFKHREIICTLDLILQLGADQEKYDWHVRYRQYEYMNDKYLVFITHDLDIDTLVKDQQKIWGAIYIPDHRIFVWTVVTDLYGKNDVQFSLHHIYFICTSSLDPHSNLGSTSMSPSVLRLKENVTDGKIRMQMDIFAASIRKQLFWIKPSRLSYRKLGRWIKLPYVERFFNLNFFPSNDFIQFIKELLTRTNFTEVLNINEFSFGSPFSVSDRLVIVDETDSFNFITCISSDTFWSIAELFWRPYQPPVWASLCFTLIGSAVFLATAHSFRKFESSPLKMFTSIIFNLIEVKVEIENPNTLAGTRENSSNTLWTFMLC